jgi:hypothetical protein
MSCDSGPSLVSVGPGSTAGVKPIGLGFGIDGDVSRVCISWINMNGLVLEGKETTAWWCDGVVKLIAKLGLATVIVRLGSGGFACVVLRF